ncbi:hypothetical protein [Agrobacterium tumefaciens]|uniref:hypothetical protein n=1 Tax=Agrobacterium tumefaciens TaxID=358 RepID=UPI001CC15106|nr:hypothetical protein [Agrobacterium tumefaciens]MDP9875614.1 hypothetical protein [Agrobacterium tumefaciens]MDP9980529.1 hypothetical protein [Agrobacterium tumefaciens]
MTAVKIIGRPKSMFRVVYRDGTTIITSAASSLQAERNAVSKRPGIVKEIKFVKGSR